VDLPDDNSGFASEDTTAHLLERIDADVPVWDNPIPITGVEGQASLSAGWSEQLLNTSSGAIFSTSVRWAITFFPQATGYIKVWLDEVTNVYGGSPTITALAPQVWNGSIAHPEKGVYDELNRVYLSPHIIESTRPARGERNVVISKWSFLPNYEPDISDPENPQPNGFPDPSWEPAAP
jgi:hypothetical protein